MNLPSDAEHGPDAPGRDAVPVEILRIVAEPRAGVVPEQGLPLLLEHLAEAHDARVAAEGRRRTSGFPAATASTRAAISGGGSRPLLPGSQASTRSPRGSSSRQTMPASSGQREMVMPERSRSRSTVSYSWTTPSSRSARSQFSSDVPASGPSESAYARTVTTCGSTVTFSIVAIRAGRPRPSPGSARRAYPPAPGEGTSRAARARRGRSRAARGRRSPSQRSPRGRPARRSAA